jgi:hypothetical protein
LRTQIDILENEILERYPKVLDILLQDHITQKNLIWATNNYEHLGVDYLRNKQITTVQITGKNGNIIMPRAQKNSILQQSRVKNMAEVFTPSWICNAQNNLIDNSWFQRNNVFNKEMKDKKGWETIKEKLNFPNNKTWRDYIKEKRLEITCGEAPYITSRYDITSGKFIAVEDRIGLLDRKLRVINENVHNSGDWLKAAQIAYKNTYAYEWQGDSLLLARESMLFTFIENFKYKFDKEPLLKSIRNIAYIISWNVWQMDGLKGVVPFSCGEIQTKTINLFGEEETDNSFCTGCLEDNIFKHNGIYCLVMDWSNKNLKGKKLRFIDLIENKT